VQSIKARAKGPEEEHPNDHSIKFGNDRHIHFLAGLNVAGANFGRNHLFSFY
jgi:hypothetical protein